MGKVNSTNKKLTFSKADYVGSPVWAAGATTWHLRKNLWFFHRTSDNLYYPQTPLRGLLREFNLRMTNIRKLYIPVSATLRVALSLARDYHWPKSSKKKQKEKSDRWSDFSFWLPLLGSNQRQPD